jgi:hypothetical protein
LRDKTFYLNTFQDNATACRASERARSPEHASRQLSVLGLRNLLRRRAPIGTLRE